MSKVAVVIPNHKTELNELEKISLAQCRKILGRYPLIHAVPEGKNFSYFKSSEFVVEFPAKYFQSLLGYNILSVSPLFYEPFADFDYILIYQLDAFVFYDALEEFCSFGYDYIGAPWPRHTWQGSRNPKTPQVGNSGLCLRKIEACRKLAEQTKIPQNWSVGHDSFFDDGFFAKCGISKKIEFNVAPVEVANLFSMEWYPDRHIERFGLPFGCHSWTKLYTDFYVELFKRFGYDLQPFREQMGGEDYQNQLSICLSNVAMERLIRAAERGQSLLEYLPTKHFASIRVIRSSGAMKILSRLLTEENSLTDKIFLYSEENWTDLLRDVTCEDLPHLVIVADYDASLIKALEQSGLRYGEHVISLQREYLKHCEKLFHRLGR
ncbi:MAG: hypothetical protein IKE46_08620 [Selenomonadaceae bacterium]|nr:hypothetical protein [Selenomonadaceae bacterium]